MTGRWRKTVLATLVVGLVSAGTATAAPIVVGQWTWTDLGVLSGDDDIPLGSEFAVTNSSDSPSEDSPGAPPILPLPAGWQSGDFSNVVVTLNPTTSCPVPVDCSVPLPDVGAGQSATSVEFIDTLAVASATLTLDFLGQNLTSTISAVGDGGLLIYNHEPVPVPEPLSLALVALGGAAGLAERRRRRACW